ncbi:MAG: acetate--CoA ligase family protein, partial [Candidatus Heimdallarchaeota archaeon]|nr:acetate--CoA ligase family protein [Candidatus Heimdallarchaeota archaeon]
LIEDARGYFPNIGLLGVDIQQMSPKGREIIIGISEDPQFGHLIMVGTGGIYANYHKDVQFGLIPLNQSEAKDMLLQTRIYQIMKGVRGEEADDIEKTIEILLRISNLVTDFPEILELDINPLFVFKKDVSALDVKITLSREKLSERYSNEI